MSKVLIVGGGAAGMLASIFAARNGNEVHVFEKNEKLGKKLFITGKGRCNITNAGDMENLFENVVSNRKFLYSSFYSYTNEDVISFFETLGVPTKIERGNRVFPVSDHSSDVIGALSGEMKRYSYTNEDVISFFETLGVPTKIERGNRVFPVSDHSSDVIGALSGEMKRAGVKVHLYTKVSKILTENGRFSGLEFADGACVQGDACVIATGGVRVCRWRVRSGRCLRDCDRRIFLSDDGI